MQNAHADAHADAHAVAVYRAALLHQWDRVTDALDTKTVVAHTLLPGKYTLLHLACDEGAALCGRLLADGAKLSPDDAPAPRPNGKADGNPQPVKLDSARPTAGVSRP